MLAPTPDASRQLSDLLHRGLDLPAFFDAVDLALASVVPFDASCWMGLDPSTLLPTSHFTRETDVDQMLRIAENEFLEEDVNKFSDLAQADLPVGLLNEATGGVPMTSKRYRDILAPHGFEHGDELRAVFLEGDSVWGCVTLHRRHGSFSRREAEIVAALGASHIGEGIHRAALTTALAAAGGDSDVPGLLLVGPGDSIESVTPSATRMLDELVDSTRDATGLPLVLASLVSRVRGDRTASGVEVATARLPRTGGGWLALYGSMLGDGSTARVGIMVYPEDRPHLPPTVAAAYALSAREQEVSSLVLQGCSTRDIAELLHLSPYTVQDHLKKVFSKVGVNSRRELVSHVFREHYAPRLTSADASRHHAPT